MKDFRIKLKNGFTPIKSGFTLVELLIVIAVIGILATGAITIINPLAQLQKANDARRKSDLSQIQKALDAYYQDYGKYSDAVDNKIRRSDGSTCSGSTCAADWGSVLWQPYMSTLPKDPTPSKSYIYYANPDGQTYYIYANLDRGANDPQACNAGNACTSMSSNRITPNACGGICNYGVSSPNVSP